MSVSRKHLFAALAAFALVYGATELRGNVARAGDDPVEPEKKRMRQPEWLTAALAEMKATRRLGVAIVLPDGEDAREALRVKIENLLRRAPLEAQVHLLEAVYVVIDGRHVGASEGSEVVFLDADGKRIAEGKLQLTPAAFAASVRAHLRATDAFAAQVKAARTHEVVKALTELAALDPEKDGSWEKIESRTAWLAERFASAGPAVIDAFESAKPGVAQMPYYRVIDRAFTLRRGDDATTFERPLPFGAQWKKNASTAPEPDPCPPCGMMRMPPRHRDVLELLVQDAVTEK